MTDANSPPPYSPIGCGQYSEYEVAILHRQKLRLRWLEGNVIYEKTVLPVDLKTKDHEEFLICRADDGVLHTIRLDHIHKMTPV